MTQGNTILFYGDSITDGGRLRGKENEWDLNHQMGHCYAYLINSRLGMDYPERSYSFYNRGITGNRIIDLYARLREDVINLAPDLVSILIGINDCFCEINSQSGAEPAKFERIYRLMLEELAEKLPETKCILCEPFLLPVGYVGEAFEKWESSVRPLQEITRRLAEEYGAVFVPFQQAFTDACKTREANYWIWDGVHPTVCGHELMARVWMRAAAPLLGI